MTKRDFRNERVLVIIANLRSSSTYCGTVDLWMKTFTRVVHLPFRHASLNNSVVFCKSTMLKRALSSHAINGNANSQSQANANTGFPPNTLKRKFDRTMSTNATNNSLSQLHEHVYFDENDFEDDEAIDLDWTVKPRTTTHNSDAISYSTLPPHTPSPANPPSSAPVPWSTSPLEHMVKRPAEPDSPETRPAKRRALPWQNKDQGDARYPWNKSTSAVKNEQKELRKRSAVIGAVANKVIAGDPVATTHLSDEQLAVAKAVVDDGKSVFFTGSAGTGKSVLMRAIIARLKRKHARDSDRLAITASTGLAACVIEGTTLHSWAGIGLGREPVPELCKRIKRNAKTKTKWLRTKVLIIDEISMVDGELFDKLEQIARSLRNNGKPFGGIQLVVTGDFFQLPPVPDQNSIAKFAFDAATWNTCIQHTILLTHVFRQKDPAFANMLNEMRSGQLSQTSIRNFQKLSRPLDFKDDIDATELFPTRQEVDNANKARMTRLSGQEMVYQAQDSGVTDETVRKKILANFMAAESLTLKKGAQVMLIKNVDGPLVNGSLGKVVAFMDEGTYHTYKDDEDTYRLAHETGGEGDSDGDAGERAHERKVAKQRFDAARFRNTDGAPSRQLWPLVRFPLPDGTIRELLCLPEEWKTENQQNEITAKRLQVPLILAWALSIHKAQGQTLSRVKVDLGKVFEKGQAYVALSRATNQAGLQVLRFNASKVMVHAKVTNFYQKLVSIDSVQK